MEHVSKFVSQLSTLHGDPLKVAAKMEYESGIDLERIKDGAAVVCEKEHCFIRIAFHAYGKDQLSVFHLNPARDRVMISQRWYELDDGAKALIIRRTAIEAMRSVPRANMLKQRDSYLTEQAATTRNKLKAPGTFQEIFGDVFDGYMKGSPKREDKP